VRPRGVWTDKKLCRRVIDRLAFQENARQHRFSAAPGQPALLYLPNTRDRALAERGRSTP
jgi:hypothetical protein